MTSPRTLLIALLLLALAPAVARADTFCVNAPACSGTAEATLDDARNAVIATAGTDRIEIGAGTYDAPGLFAAGVTLVGAGEGATIIQGDGGASAAVGLTDDGSSVSDLTVRLVAGKEIVGIRLSYGARADRVAVEGTDPLPSAMGFYVRSGGSIANSSVHLPPSTVPVNTGIAFEDVPEQDGPTHPNVVTDVDLTAGYGIYVQNSTLTTSVTRARIHAGYYGISLRGDATFAGQDLFADASGSSGGGAALAIRDENATGPIGVTLKHATLLSTSPGGKAIDAGVDEGKAETITMSDTLLDAHADAYSRSIVMTGVPISLDATYSAFSGSRVSRSAPDVQKITLGAGIQNTDYAPINLAASGAPGPGSVLIDNGTPGADPGGHAAFDGDGDGTARADIGAGEAPAATSKTHVDGFPIPAGPFTVAPSPGPGSSILKATKKKLAGTAEFATAVKVSIRRRVHGVYKKPKFSHTATLDGTKWSLTVKLKPGRYKIVVRAERGQLHEATVTRRILRVKR